MKTKFMKSLTILLILVLAFGGVQSIAFAKSSTSFVDIEGSYAKDIINTLQSKGVLHGVDATHFNPQGTLTRAQFVAIIVRALGLSMSSIESSFTDVSGWSVPSVEAAFHAGFIAGIGNSKFDPNGTLTREAAATILVRVFKTKCAKVENKAILNFTDANQISDWAKPFIAAAQSYGLIMGYPDGSFKPLGDTNREMGAVMGSNLLNAIELCNATPTPTVTPVVTPTPTVTPTQSPTPVISGGGNVGSYVPPVVTTPAPSPSPVVTPLPTPVVTPVPIVGIKDIHIESNNADHAYAKDGDVVTLSFSTDEQVFKQSSFKINGSNPDTFTETVTGDVYTVTGSVYNYATTHVVDSSDLARKMNFQINVKNAAGTFSVTTEATTDGSSVTVQRAPQITAVNLSSNNTDPKKALNGDTVTLTFTTNQEVSKLGNFKINGSNLDTFASTGSGDVWNNTATLLIGASDPEGLVNFQINVKNAAGLFSITTEATNDNSFVTVVKTWKETPVVISNVNLSSSNDDHTKAFNGDTVKLTFKTTEQVSKLGNFKINGSNPNTFKSTGSGNDWTNTATYQIGKDDPAGLVTFQINVKNADGIYSTTVEATTDSSSVEVMQTWKDTPIEISDVSISTGGLFGGNNCNRGNASLLKAGKPLPCAAIAGDTVNLSFATNEQVMKLSNFKIDGNNPDLQLTISPGLISDKWLYVAAYTIQDSDPAGLVTFQINVKNISGVYSKTVEETSDGSSIRVVKAPVISNVSISSDYSDSTKAVPGSAVTLKFNTDQQVTNNHTTIDGNRYVGLISLGAGNSWNNTVTYLLGVNDTVGPVTFGISVNNVFGQTSTANATTDGTSVQLLDRVEPSISISGKSIIHVPYGGTYNDEGVTANDNVDGNITNNIVATITGPSSTTVESIDTHVAGQYVINYNVSDAAGNAAADVTRYVIVDPDLTAYYVALSKVHESDYTPTSWAAYKDVLSHYVMTTGNTQNQVDHAVAEIVTAQNHVLVLKDVTPPVIKLIGDNPLHVAFAAKSWTDPGVSVTDDRDTNVFAVRTITDPSGAPVEYINSGTPGTYTIHYNATDSAGNKAIEVTRAVIMAQPSNVATVSAFDIDFIQVTQLTDIHGEIYISIANSISRQVFLNGLFANGPGQAWDESGLSEMVQRGNTLTVTAQDGVTKVTYIITMFR